jgi:cysteine-rich repeat protein
VSCTGSQAGLIPVCDPTNNSQTYYQKRTNKNLPNSLSLCSVGIANPSPASYTGGQVAVNASGSWNWSCDATTSVACNAKHIYCGDGIPQSGTDSAGKPYVEACDDGNTNNNDGCTTRCNLSPIGPIFCGNGIVEQPNAAGDVEICDDGNSVDGDGCSSTCEPESSIYSGTCSSSMQGKTFYATGTPDTTTLCSFGLMTGFVFTTGSQQWTWSCLGSGTTNTSCMATHSYCGDAVVGTGMGYSNQEQCDNGTGNGVVCNPAYASTCNYCSPTCQTIVLT